MTDYELPPLEAKFVIAFTLECRDKDGQLVQTIDCKTEQPVEIPQENLNDDQRSE